MSLSLESIIDLMSSSTFETIQLVILLYVGLLWLSIIIWVTKDSISRSDSLLFQVFSILINIVIPILGIVLYLIIRPGQTIMERYYEELEHRLILEKSDQLCSKCGRELGKSSKKTSKSSKK